jgi:hypothetical protein
MAQPEQKKSYHVSKNFRGVNTQASRTAIDGDEFSWLENAMPIGFANVKVVGSTTTVQVGGSNVTFSSAVTAFYSANIANSDYVVAFQTNGGAQYYNITSGTFGTIAAASKFSTSGVRVGQWKNERLLICDPAKGLFTWDGTNVVSVGSASGYGITNGGSGYTSAPSVAISAPNETGGVQATAVATVTSGAVTGLTFTEAGTGYTSAPTITFTGGGGSSAAAVASCLTFATGTVSVAMLSGGTGYSTPPTVNFTGGGGSGAAGTAVVSGGQVIAVVMTNNGTGYTSPPTIGFSTGAAIAQAAVTTQANVDVQSFSGRVWLAQGRTVFYSAAGSYNNFVSVSAGNILLTDSTLHGNISALLSANNFLYIFGEDSINVFSDVRVQTNGTSIFTNTNVSASVGTRRAGTIFPYFRSVLFLNDYGVYALVGSTTSKLSSQLDGIFPLIDFTKPVTGGQVLLNNILCAAWSFTYNDPIQGARQIQAVFFDKRWFFTSQKSVLYMTSLPLAGKIYLYATTSTDLYTMYTSSAGPSVQIQTALWPLTDPIRDKQALKLGIEATFPNSVGTLSVTVDNEYRSSPVYTLTSGVPWVNNQSSIIPWTNNSSAVIQWFNSGYQLYKTDAQQYGKYLGVTITSTSSVFSLNTVEMEYEMRARF